MLHEATNGRIHPRGSWRQPQEHLAALVNDPWYGLVLRLHDEICESSREFFRRRGIRSLFVPVTTESISSPIGAGSDSLPVAAEIDGRRVYLADSMQFMLELGLRLHRPGVYYVSTSFRGEQVDERHLSEFCHSEVEIPGSLDDILGMAGAYVHHLVVTLHSRSAADVLAAAGTLSQLERVMAMGGNFPRIRFESAFRLLGGRPPCFREVLPGHWAITQEGEARLMREFGECVWLTHLPQMTCPFYQRPEPGTPYCLSADLLLGRGEALGAGERCPDGETVLASIERHKIAPESYKWYVEMKNRWPVQTSGFGLGVERLLLWAMGAVDIRDCTLWIRDRNVRFGP